jgi:hypothetical protein
METKKMAEPLSIGASIDLAKAGWEFLEYVRRVAGAEVISGYFKADGTRIEGSPKVVVELHRVSNPAIWWYSVKSIEDYVSLREPTNPTCAHELVGLVGSEKQPDSRFWRWIAPVLPGRIYGGDDPPNLKVDFLVFGYRPRALLKHFSDR